MKRGLFRNMQGAEQAGTQSVSPLGWKEGPQEISPSLIHCRPMRASMGEDTDLKMKGGGVVKERGGVARAGLHHVHRGAPTAAFKEQPKICILIYNFLV